LAWYIHRLSEFPLIMLLTLRCGILACVIFTG